MSRIVHQLDNGILVPSHFTPRWYQVEVFDAWSSGCLRIIEMWHRKTGKDLTAIALMAMAMVQRVGNYYYFFPKYTQGRKILWQGTCSEGIRFMDRIPKELIEIKRNNEMFIQLKNGSTLNIVGADNFNVDSLIGIGPVGAVMSEYGVGEDYGIVMDLFRPALRQTGGWLLINGTPRGKNHYYDLVERVKNIPDRWFVSSLQTISPDFPTGRYTGLVTPQELQDEIEEGMDQSTLEQEYGISFNAGVKGAIFGSVIARAQETGRIGNFPVDSHNWVDTLWDLGNADMATIWFLQRSDDRVIFVDYYQNNNEDWAYYVEVLKNKGYKFKTHYLPHDANARYLMSKLKPKHLLEECVKSSGIGGKVKVLKKPKDKTLLISAARRRFCYYYFDEGLCQEGIRLVERYRKRYDAVRKVFTSEPIHDESSHCCDALMLEPLIKIKSLTEIERPSYSDYASKEYLRDNKKSILDRFRV